MAASSPARLADHWRYVTIILFDLFSFPNNRIRFKRDSQINRFAIIDFLWISSESSSIKACRRLTECCACAGRWSTSAKSSSTTKSLDLKLTHIRFAEDRPTRANRGSRRDTRSSAASLPSGSLDKLPLIYLCGEICRFLTKPALPKAKAATLYFDRNTASARQSRHGLLTMGMYMMSTFYFLAISWRVKCLNDLICSSNSTAFKPKCCMFSGELCRSHATTQASNGLIGPASTLVKLCRRYPNEIMWHKLCVTPLQTCDPN